MTKPPLQDEKGEIGPIQRIQGSLKYGFSWYSELEAQKSVITQLDRSLEKGFVLIRNYTLPGLDVVEPIILIGLSGISVIYVTHLAGFYEAKGDQWNTVNNGRSTPVADNLIRRVGRLAKALQVYLERQGVHLPSPVEPVLIASSAAMHIDSMRPAVRVVQSDGIKSFALSLLQARPVLQTELIFDLAERITNGYSASTPPKPAPQPQPAKTPAAEAPQQTPSRAQAIFRSSSAEAAPSNPNDFGFAFEEAPAQTSAANVEAQPAKARPRRIMGMTVQQVLILAAIFLIGLCGVAAFGYLILFAQ